MAMTTLRRASALALACLLTTAAIAFADTIRGDGDQVTPGNQGVVPLGSHAPGEVVKTSVDFQLICGGLNHVEPDQSVSITLTAATVPFDGTATATSTSLGPVPATWTADNDGCPFPAPTMQANKLSDVTLRMPTTTGLGQQFTLLYERTGAPDLAGLTVVTFEVDVVPNPPPNTPPTLSVPSPLTAEATSAAGATVEFVASAIDAEDNPDPTPTCAPASGTVFSLGTTTVSCSVKDDGGKSATGSFTVTVVDTTPPVLDLPGDQTAEATSAAGATVSFTTSASDIVDGPVSVGCDHASGDTFPLGMTTVACSATDVAGNPASGSFHVTVGDTGDPTLIGMPSNVTLTTANPAGAVLAYTMPTATDAADPNPIVSCLPAPGATAPVGNSTVTCTATDAVGNNTTGTFGVSVTYVSSAAYSAVWGEPVGGSPAMLVTNSSRTIPIKLRLFVDGVEQTAGSASLRVTACNGDTALVLPLSWGSGRWSTHLDMSRLGAGCYVVAAMLNGNSAGSFALDVRGPDAAKTPAANPAPTPAATTAPADTTGSAGTPSANGNGVGKGLDKDDKGAKDKTKPPKK